MEDSHLYYQEKDKDGSKYSSYLHRTILKQRSGVIKQYFRKLWWWHEDGPGQEMAGAVVGVGGSLLVLKKVLLVMNAVKVFGSRLRRA